MSRTAGSPPIRVRVARPADEAAISVIVRRAYDRYVEQIGRPPAPMSDDYCQRINRGEAFVAEQEGLVGLIVLVLEQTAVLVDNVAVDPLYQGQGVGRMLMSFGENFARRHDRRTIRLYTNAAMVENLRLYAHLGYNEVDRREEDGFQRVFLSKLVGLG